MVYCGRPSLSCARCRAKKKRCDKATPACGQCRRTGHKCPGYHDVSALIFRDETRRVIHRAQTVHTHGATVTLGNSPAFTPSPATTEALSAVGLYSPSPAASSHLSAGSPAPNSSDGEDRPGNDLVNSRDDAKDSGNEGHREQGGFKDQISLGDVLDNIIHGDNDDPSASDEMQFFTSESNMSWEKPGQLVALPSLSPGSASSPGCDLRDGVMSMLIAPAAPSESLHELGISYFLTNYVLPDSGPCPGFLNYTLEILADPLGDEELTQAAVRAVGLSGLASTTGAETIMRKARASYAEAIERVNTALVDPELAVKDSTIFAVMVLGLFETITCSNSESLEAWTHHINGAANLLMHRGKAQFQTKRGLRIFGEAVSHVLTLCTRYGRSVPPRLRFLRVEMQRTSVLRTDPSRALSSAHIEVLDLYHRVAPDSNTPFLPTEWEELLSHAVELDRRLENLIAELPDLWRFKTVNDPAANPRVVYRGTYHIYYSTWVAKVWNGVRACRIILSQAIYCLLMREGITWAPMELATNGGAYTEVLQRAAETTSEMRDGILASVPQMLGFVQHDADRGTSYLDCCSADMPRLVPAAGAYFLLWYLFLAGGLPHSSATRAWVVDRLRAIRAATGIQKAEFLADMLETNPAFADAVLPSDGFLLPDV
ncbi:hypothetical protein NLU13_9648 [Sarocladium strictum]|uniref:Zn(2)-C6 fungal-type domain-containing protein n=1 Tax=Sarocladium strictum TaxID=5046 RepID=A0AA39GAH4_SARSR|nr:hypothetical protein NLU13_9648 [Sarocladium strictum]